MRPSSTECEQKECNYLSKQNLNIATMRSYKRNCIMVYSYCFKMQAEIGPFFFECGMSLEQLVGIIVRQNVAIV